MRGAWFGYMGQSQNSMPFSSSRRIVSPDLSMNARTIRGPTVR